jgi:hypothetical protein
LLDKSACRNPALDASLEHDIARHKYDIVIYGSVHRGLPHWELVHRYYEGRDVVLICGEDLHECGAKKLGVTHDLFVREL